MRVSARRRIELRGRASHFIKLADIKPGDKIYLVCRVSGHEQGRQNNHADQNADLRRQVEERGGIVVDVLQIVKSGFDPCWLRLFALRALADGATLLGETPDRFVRHPLYHSEHAPDLQARHFDLQELAEWTCGVPLATIVDPDATPWEVRSYQRKRGQRMKGNYGGRPETSEQIALRRTVQGVLNRLPH